MTTELFTNRLKSTFYVCDEVHKQFKLPTKALLIIENAPANDHNIFVGYEEVRIKFLPQNTISFVAANGPTFIESFKKIIESYCFEINAKI